MPSKSRPGKPQNRCSWAKTNELFFVYHDEEWGRAVHDDRLLFEMLCLEGAQAGLSWLTILKKRDRYRKVFDKFDAKKVARYSEKKKAILLKDAGIIRNRLKVHAFVENAKAFLLTQKEFGSFDAYIWHFVDQKSLIRPKKNMRDTISGRMSKDLKKRGFRFVGPTICYAFMQAVGVADDHENLCFRVRK